MSLEKLTAVYRQLNGIKGSGKWVQELLREIQLRGDDAKQEVNVSGSKEEQIENLRQAVSSGHATLREVQELLWAVEEFGRQHILLLTPAPTQMSKTLVDVSNAKEVGSTIHDGLVIADHFPRYEYPTSGYIWSDFRVDSVGWTAKAYGREVYRQSHGVIGHEENDDGTFHEIRQYSMKETNVTLVARWREMRKILELRIDVSGLQNEKAVETRRQELWKLLSPAFRKSDFLGVSVDQLLKNLIFERSKSENSGRYSMHRVELVDPSSGQVRVIPANAEPFDAEEGRTASLDVMRENSYVPSSVRLKWHAGQPGCPPCMKDSVSVVVEKTKHGPEIRILKKVSEATYEYIFNQLQIRR